MLRRLLEGISQAEQRGLASFDVSGGGESFGHAQKSQISSDSTLS
jgi:hypothetical protein